MSQVMRGLVAVCVAFFALAGDAADRTLIISIAAYPVSPLPGPSLDEDNARQTLSRPGLVEYNDNRRLSAVWLSAK